MHWRCAPAQCKCEAQAAAVEQLSHELMFAGEVAEDEARFVAAEDGWDAARGSGTSGVEGRFERETEDRAI
jgi:hypothetical protein